ncbi:hypothetical protein M2283_005900 [Streptomyces pseudovenezuelae]|uniref:Uncharacterized protein n=1 Tax=Streptomyces pseudovenezuelae TaxID=67350 RepID=A0ABT6LQI3_9ACTN|nr:hypothetical protein [Streptomyces pseudovenezuelae]
MTTPFHRPIAPAATTRGPAAADGEPAPQGPPAPDNEFCTAGAGGNSRADGEAEAEVAPTTTPSHHKKAAI